MSERMAPEWSTTEWLNCKEPLTLAGLRGRVVMVHAFQMLCPGCVARGLPQAQRVAELFRQAPITVVGLHSVFEHHDAMRPHALRAFLHEYRIRFPVGVDAPGENGDPIPRTMRAYGNAGHADHDPDRRDRTRSSSGVRESRRSPARGRAAGAPRRVCFRRTERRSSRLYGDRRRRLHRRRLWGRLDVMGGRGAKSPRSWSRIYDAVVSSRLAPRRSTTTASSSGVRDAKPARNARTFPLAR